MIIAPVNFRDEEFFEPKAEFEKNGIEVTVACKSLNAAKGKFEGIVKPDMVLADIHCEDFNAVVFVGGSGSSVYFDDPAAHTLAQDAYRKGKIVAAICSAPVILGRAGILQGKKATVFPDDAQDIQAHGAVYTGKSVETDGNIITGNGPKASWEFGQVLVKAVQKKGKE
jgi:protease I